MTDRDRLEKYEAAIKRAKALAMTAAQGYGHGEDGNLCDPAQILDALELDK